MERVLRALTHKRFWCWLFRVCWFLGHDPKFSGVPKSLYLHGEWVDGGEYYCARCQSAKPSCYGGLPPTDEWRGHLLIRAIWLPLRIKMARALNRNEFFPEETDNAFQAFLRRVDTWLKEMSAKRHQRKTALQLAEWKRRRESVTS